MAQKRPNRDKLVSDKTKRSNLNYIRKLPQTEESNIINSGPSSSNVDSNIPTANRSSKNYMEIINDMKKLFQTQECRITFMIRKAIEWYGNNMTSTHRSLSVSRPLSLLHINMKVIETLFGKIMKFHDSLPAEEKQNEDELLNIMTFALRRDFNWRGFFKKQESEVITKIKRGIRLHFTNNGSSSSNVNFNSNISHANTRTTLNSKDVRTFLTKLFKILIDHRDSGFEKLGRVYVPLRKKKRSKEFIEKIDITEIFKMHSCDTLSYNDKKSSVKNVIGIVDDLKNLGFLETSHCLSDPLSKLFQKFLEKAWSDVGREIKLCSVIK